MKGLPLPGAVTRLWSRPWARRITYVLASGALLAGLGGYLATRPAVDAWIVSRISEALRKETGLTLQAERLEVHPFRGRFIFHRLGLGGDLLQADRLEVEVELGSLLRQPHLRDLVLVNPALRLDKGRLARIHLKPSDPRKEAAKVRLDRLQVTGGHAWVDEPAWGLRRGEFAFRIQGRGWAPNQIRLDLEVPVMGLGEGRERLQGNLSLKAGLSDKRIDLEQAALRLGHNALTAKGSLLLPGGRLEAQAHGNADLAEALRLALPGKPEPAKGLVAFSAQASGPLDHLTWKTALQGQNLSAKDLPLHPGSLRLNAAGAPDQIRLAGLQWDSPDGHLSAQGEWTPRGGTRVELTADRVPLAPVAGYTRSGFLKDLSARVQGKATLPGAPWEAPRLERLGLRAKVQLLQQGEPVGGLELASADRRIRLTDLALELPEVQLHGTAEASLAPRGLGSLQADLDLRTGAEDVAGMLQVWDIGSRDDHGKVEAFDMAGLLRAAVHFAWSRREGIQLKGDLDVDSPRWHGAKGDRLRGNVTIDRDVLRVSDIQLEKGQGNGAGEFFLTWSKHPPGGENMDMCYRMFRLPVHEGLRAADQGDLPIQGTASGWARIHGPFNHLLLDGRAVVEQGEVYGFRLPAAAADFSMDLATLRLQARDVRASDTLEHLAVPSPRPTGPLALWGAMDMDIRREHWTASLDGTADSQVLGLKGPHLQTQVQARIDGPITSPFGPFSLPLGSFSFRQGRLSQGPQTLEGLEGSLSLEPGRIKLQAGLAGMPGRVLELDARESAPRTLAANLHLAVDPGTADTRRLATQLSQDFLKDVKLDYRASGAWGPEGLAFKGTLDAFTGQFDGFQLAQARTGRIDGDLGGLSLALRLEGRTEDAPAPRPPQRGTGTSLGIQGRLPFAQEAPLGLRIAGNANMANLKSMLDRLIQPGQYSLLSDMHPGGTARLSLDLGGTFQDPSLEGSLTLRDGKVSIRTYPQSIENVAFTARFHGREILIPESEPLKGNLAQGAVKAWGRTTWSLGGLSTYDFHASVEDFQLRDLPEGFDLQGSLDATLQGNDKDGGILQGNLWAKRMLYRAEINLTDLILANAFGATPGLGGVDPSDPMARIYLDLDMHLGEPWEFDTNLLKLQGRPRGTFKIKGTLAQPGLKGRMDLLPGGRFTNLLPAGDVVLERGSVEFKDPSQFNPNIDIQGRVDISPYLVNLGISGTLDKLQVQPSSTPSLRQADIFAILVDPSAAATVGSTSSLSSQPVVSNGLLSTGSGLLSSLALANFQEEVRKRLKLDRVSVSIRSGTASPATQVVLAKSVNITGHRIPLVFKHLKEGPDTTVSGQVEWRFGNFVLQMGVSQSTGGNLNPSGEIRHTWTPE